MIQDEIQANHLTILLKHYKENKRALAHLSMRYGKTKLSYDLFKKLLPFHATILITYKDNTLKDVWEKEAVKWGYSNPNITYVNFSSLWKYENTVFDMVVCDEVHMLSDGQLDVLQRIITNDKDVFFLGLSGTISKETQQKIGVPIVVEYSVSEAIEDEIIADYSITVHLVDLDTKIKTPNKKGKLLSEKQRYDNYGYVIQQMKYQGRNSMHLALSRNRLSLSSIGKIEYLHKLLKSLKDKRYIIFTGLSSVADSIGIPSFHSKSENDENLQRFQRKEINHLALVEKGKVGLSYKDLDGVILLNFTYNMENSAQGVSRASLLDYTGKCSQIHIIALNEEPEIKKLKESLSMLDNKKIKYL